jgi:hypothetical protein
VGEHDVFGGYTSKVQIFTASIHFYGIRMYNFSDLEKLEGFFSESAELIDCIYLE